MTDRISDERLAELIAQDEGFCLLREPGEFVWDTISALRELQSLRVRVAELERPTEAFTRCPRCGHERTVEFRYASAALKEVEGE